MNARLPADDALIEQELIEAARRDVSVFCDLVLKDSKSGAPTRSAPVHLTMQALANKHPLLVIPSAIELGKSEQLIVGRTLWELGRNPNLSFLIVANTAHQASKLLGLIARYIETSDELHAIFPGLKPDPSGEWNSTALTVQRTAPSKDASVGAAGVHGNVLGARIDRVLIDDIVDFENSCTPRARDDLSRWIDSTVMGRLTADARVIVVGNVWHADDMLARLAKRPGWHSKTLAVTDLWGRSRWPERWPHTRIAQWRERLQPREAGRQLDCIPPSEADAVFPAELIGRALKLGEGASTEFFASATQPGAAIVVGVDVAFSEKATSDESSLVLARSIPTTGGREIVQVSSGRWGFDQIVQNAVTLCQINKATAAVEVNGGGEFIAQAIERTRVPVIRIHTSASSKRARAEMLLSELVASRWSFRQSGALHPEMAKLAQELCAFDYQSHAGDRVMALFAAVQAIRDIEAKPPPPRGGTFPWRRGIY